MSMQRAPGDVEDEAEDEPLRYFIDEGLFEMQSRSFEAMVEGRLADMGLAKEKGSRKRGKSSKTPFPELSKVEGFIDPRHSILEAVFRLLLIHQNKPLDAEQISQELAERGIGVMDGRVINAEVLKRMMDRDTYYGLAHYREG